MEILGKILGSQARVKVMRLFLLNQDNGFSNKEIAKRSRVNRDTLRRELSLLKSISFIKKKGKDWIYNPAFKYGQEMENLLINSDSVEKEALVEAFRKTGRVKLIIVAGIFIKNKDSRLDFLIVGDKLKKGKIEDGMRRLEAEIGTELSYAVFDTKEFIYRLDMYDKLIRDVLDFPHEIVFQGKGMSLGKAPRPN